MSGRGRVLVVEDDVSLRRVARHELTEAGFEVELAEDGERGLAAFVARRPDAVLTDVRMPGPSGMELLAAILAESPETPVLVMTGQGSVRDAVAAVKRGAADYLTKPVDWGEVAIQLERALERRRLREDNARLRGELAAGARLEELVGDSPPMAALRGRIARLLATDATVLVTGESGTGKELVARALHFHGDRRAGPFVAVNCGAIPRDLIASQLFGHVRGAFTGALRDADGAFVEASGGTLFLDEVGEVPLDAQPTLLRALAERAVQPVGASRPRPVDVRVVAATNRDLQAAVAEGDFREDLYYRLAVVPLAVPPLRERGDDVLQLARHVLARRGLGELELAPEAAAALAGHAWPGNVRELRNALESAALLRVDPARIALADLPESVRAPRSPLPTLLAGSFPAEGLDLAELERECLRRALDAAGGNRTRAARLLGVTRQTLLYRLQKHGLR